MAAGEILNLFDSLWFEYEIFSKKPAMASPPVTNQLHKIDEEDEEPKLSRVLTLRIRSMSDQFLDSGTSFSSNSMSPNSVLHSPKLQTILSGKEVGEIADPEEIPVKKKLSRNEMKSIRRRRRRGCGSCKSLSDLEFEELKGFMDLGFVFSEEDKDSSLVSIIPGLQRLGKKEEDDSNERDDEEGCSNECVVSRPYLSEAWEVLDRRKEEKKALMMTMNWRIPYDLGNEVDMKDHLRSWAHTVASTVR